MSPVIKKKKVDLGAGLRVSKDNIAAHPAGPPRYGELTQAERAFTLASTFLSGVLAISASQFLGAPLKLIDPQFYEGYMAYTKECFAILITCLTQWWAPTVVRVSGDSSMVGQLIQKKDGSLECKFADRMVLMANHQLYTDWLYLWWIAYTNNMHGFVYIILKESLRNIPIIGWSAQFYNFIFLARNWEEDQRRFKKALSRLNGATQPMWLIIFPEGTNLSSTTREKSKAWATKNNLQDMKHQLLPRSTGLRFCLNELKDTTEWLYDCTIAYEGVPPGQFGQDIFTLRSTFFEGRPPKSVNMHWRRFHISDIPIQNTKAFEVWLRNRWREKDYMLEYFQKHSRFPAENFWKDHLDMGDRSSQGSQSIRSVPRPAVQIETEVKSGNWNEFVKIFAPISSVLMALTVAYGANPADLIPGGKEFFEQHMKQLLNGGGEMGGLPSPDQLEKMIEGAAKLGAAQAADSQQMPQVAALTQENLAKLVKETAIKNGVVLPGGMRRASTALPQAPTRTLATPTAVPTRAKSAIVTPASAQKSLGATAKAKPATAVPTKVKAAPVKPKVPARSKPTPPTGPMKEVALASGVTIKVPATAVEEPKKPGATTIKTANGLTLNIGKKDIEKAQEKKGETVMSAGGIPIKITSSGKIEVAKKPARARSCPTSKPAAKKAAAAPAKAPPKLNGTTSAPKKIATKPSTPQAKAPPKLATK
ncbi:1-acyl-sn-glycerol-3-phosphate acyltransferase gamma [Didymella exigua CBS 183.55]|uniref:1-acyl-sn-glycerol-3-phosphate acyltransferase gamma n=1 Tax=Didymella exigua CBS 183.55 TaxID=1150837 RepID=A0A6A5RYE6_9PLEO|nr:1-acyl-sn-glycerol-3-phosphate acyltransferase gamma [Didymella exigua CBS 183.55]KAF1930277.1 1-acyl-sn-glycerol-3-phosphate acyltransferase gamma [Didymella exigua CBS 183.55]